jgi:DNA-binding XRE family transcriptional regulator
VDGLQVGRRDAGVDRGAVQARVAEELLDEPDIGAGLEEMGRAGVAQGMRRDRFLEVAARLVARKAAGLTQVELAEAIGTSQRMVAYYESTGDYPLARLLRQLSRTLGVSADELLGLAPPSARPAVKRSRGSKRRKR